MRQHVYLVLVIDPNDMKRLGKTVNLVTFVFASVLKRGFYIRLVQAVCQNLVVPWHNINFIIHPGDVRVSAPAV